MPTVKTSSGIKRFPYTEKGKAAAKAAKKAVLKKYTGKGGHYSAEDIRRINQEDMMKPTIDMSKAPGPMRVLGGMTKRVAGDVASGVSRGVRGIKNVVGRGVDSYTSKMKKMDDYRNERDQKIIERMGKTPEEMGLKKMPKIMPNKFSEKISILKKKLVK